MFDLQLTRQRPRWHFVDIGQMSEPFLDSAVLRDDVHPNTDVMMTVLQMYLNLHVDHGKPLPPVQFPIQDFKEWDSQDFTEKVTRWMEDYHRQKPKYHPSPPSYSSTTCFSFRSSIFWCSCAKARDDFQRVCAGWGHWRWLCNLQFAIILIQAVTSSWALWRQADVKSASFLSCLSQCVSHNLLWRVGREKFFILYTTWLLVLSRTIPILLACTVASSLIVHPAKLCGYNYVTEWQWFICRLIILCAQQVLRMHISEITDV